MSHDGRNGSLFGKQLYIDCFAGIAGDMFLGAMLDLGVPEEVVRQGLACLDLGQYELVVGRAVHMGIVGTDVKVKVAPRADAGGDEHAHHTWRSIRSMLESSSLLESVRQRAIEIFGRIALAEGRLHGKEPEDVAFHEVGAVDSIVDIVGAALALDHLAPIRVTSRPVPLGHGTTRCAHGVLPVPSPAAVEILAGAMVEDGGAPIELCTPTGAAIVASIVTGYGELPSARLVAQGYGAGDRHLDDRPNHLRLLLFDAEQQDSLEHEAVVVEANVDNMPHEWCGHLMERLMGAGARDAWYTPIVMKKGRPALTVSALCASARRHAVAEVMLSESTTIGLRHHRVGRQVLARESVEVESPHGRLRLKVAREGDRVLNVAPEYEDCKAAADRCGVPLKEVYAAALCAYRSLADSRGRG